MGLFRLAGQTVALTGLSYIALDNLSPGVHEVVLLCFVGLIV